MTKLKPKDRTKILADVVAATKGEKGFAMIHKDHAKELADAGHVEVNTQIVDGDSIAVRATASLLASAPADGSAPAAVTDAVTTQPTFELLSGIPLPAIKRGGIREEQYPFSKMEVGQSFFVPCTAEYPKPWDSFASTVSSATRRFSVTDPSGKTRTSRKGATVEVLVPTKKFTLRQVRQGDTYAGTSFVEPANGARVFRIQ